MGARTSDPLAVLCPECGAMSAVKEQVTTAPADVDAGGRQVWIRHRRRCPDPRCLVASFTESLPQVPPRSRLTTGLRERAACLVADQALTPTQATTLTGTSCYWR